MKPTQLASITIGTMLFSLTRDNSPVFRCNINNLPSVYQSLLAATRDVMNVLSDVEELLRETQSSQNWQNEWIKVVQDLLDKDSGWEYVHKTLSARV